MMSAGGFLIGSPNKKRTRASRSNDRVKALHVLLRLTVSNRITFGTEKKGMEKDS